MVDPTAAAAGAKGFLTVMKDQPVLLALCVISFALVGLLYMQSTAFTAQRRENVALFVQVQSEVQKLLAQCIIPPPPQREQRGEIIPLPPSKPVFVEP